MNTFRGLAFDIDKTAVPNGAKTVESRPLIDGFQALPDDVYAFAATGRSPEFALPITRALRLRHESVVANGALIIDSISGEVSWDRLLTEEQTNRIILACKPFNHRLWFTGDPEDSQLTPSSQIGKVTAGAFFTDLPRDIALKVHDKVIHIPDVTGYLSPAWGGGEDCFDLNISHVGAGKGVALGVLFERHGLERSEMIGIGDGVNDLELFGVVGHKVAVANAHQDLLNEADEVVGSQENGGLLQVLQRFHASSPRY